MIKYLKIFLSENSGASAVEFALISPILIMLIIGTVDIGLLINDRIEMQNISNSVAEYVAKTQDDSDIEIIAAEMHGSDYEGVTLTSQFECECLDAVVQICPVVCADDDYQRRYISVSASRPFDPIFLYPTMYTGGKVLDSTVRMRVD